MLPKDGFTSRLKRGMKMMRLHPRMVRLGWIYFSKNKILTCRRSQVCNGGSGIGIFHVN
ncbi:hypothetical protein HanPSC8_Chr02g0063191 [Helianthus annuus]|nr:hypothetical protein HanPSC8_Chr02g0063191 [Helianthus annuus]